MINQKKKTRIDDLHFEHELWLASSKFYADELRIYQKRLDEIATKNNSFDVRAQIEHFQNQFIIQKEQLDILNHDVHKHESWLAKFALEHPVAIDHQQFDDHYHIQNRMDTFIKIYNDLKTEFNKFLSVWM